MKVIIQTKHSVNRILLDNNFVLKNLPDWNDLIELLKDCYLKTFIDKKHFLYNEFRKELRINILI